MIKKMILFLVLLTASVVAFGNTTNRSFDSLQPRHIPSAFSNSKLKCDQIQSSSCAATSWKTVFSLSDGPCIITGIWFAYMDAANARIAPMGFEFDNPASGGVRWGQNPADGAGVVAKGITGDFFGCGYDDVVIYRHPLMGVTNSYTSGAPGTSWEGFSGYIRLYAPYYNTFKMYIYNPTASSTLVWAMVERIPLKPGMLQEVGLWDGVYLRTYGENVSDADGGPRKPAQYGEVTLLNESGPIALAGSYIWVNNGNWSGRDGDTFSFLEADMYIYYNNEGTASYRTSGMEDFYFGSWYFQEMYDAPYTWSGTATENKRGILDINKEGVTCIPLKNNSTYHIAMQRFWYPQYMPYAATNMKLSTFAGTEGQGTGPPGSPYYRWLTWYYK